MQRPGYTNPPPPHSPPLLHHPVPQHVSTVPQLRSPPPPSQPQSQNSYGYSGQQQQQQGQQQQQQQQQQPGGNFMHPAFGGIMNDSTAQMGFQVGKSAVIAGQEYMEQNVNTLSSHSPVWSLCTPLATFTIHIPRYYRVRILTTCNSSLIATSTSQP
jgi:hypothetical protein